jgi:predicted nucleotidyltransferase
LGTRETLSLVLFGSAALGHEGPDSDLDICVIVRNEEDKTLIEREEDLLNQAISGSFGNSLALYPVTVNEFKRRYARGDRLIKEIVQTGEVFWGKSLEEILKHGRKK